MLERGRGRFERGLGWRLAVVGRHRFGVWWIVGFQQDAAGSASEAAGFQAC